jgi:hypothetical protein
MRHKVSIKFSFGTQTDKNLGEGRTRLFIELKKAKKPNIPQIFRNFAANLGKLFPDGK